MPVFWTNCGQYKVCPKKSDLFVQIKFKVIQYQSGFYTITSISKMVE